MDAEASTFMYIYAEKSLQKVLGSRIIQAQ